MLHKITLRCTCPQEIKASYNWGSLMHGVLMDLLPEEISNALHDSNLRPFSQYILPLKQNELEWHIGLWDNEISEYIAKAVLPLSKIYIEHKEMELKVSGVERTSLSESEFMAQFFNEDTPCTHKSGGGFVLFPTPELIIQSLCMRFSAFSNEYSLDDPETMAKISSDLRIIGYSLRSSHYFIEKTKVFGYMGRLRLLIHGSDQLARLAGMLLSFSEYAGIGIKTALGMGGCRITQIKQSDENAEYSRSDANG